MDRSVNQPALQCRIDSADDDVLSKPDDVLTKNMLDWAGNARVWLSEYLSTNLVRASVIVLHAASQLVCLCLHRSPDSALGCKPGRTDESVQCSKRVRIRCCPHFCCHCNGVRSHANGESVALDVLGTDRNSSRVLSSLADSKCP